MNIYQAVNRLLRRLLVISLFWLVAIPATAATDGNDAESYYRRVSTGLDRLQEQTPSITRLAEQAAAAYVKDDFAIAAFGDPGLVSEATGRAGGLMPLCSGQLKTANGQKTIALFFPCPPDQEAELAAAVKMRKNGGILIVFGDARVKEAAKKAGIAMDDFLETAGTKLEFPLDAVMNMSALWCWTGEFVAACTRLGKIPPLYQSYSVPGAKDRAEKFRGLKFHAETSPPIAPGILGKQYLDGMKQRLATLHEKELEHIRAVAGQAMAASNSGHAVYLSVVGHALVGHAARINETGRMRTLNSGWNPVNKDIKLGKGDLVFFIGYDDAASAPTEAAKNAGAGLAWSLTDYKITPGAVPPGQIFINQRWTLGDAIITVPGYDIRILPPSGVITETILGMVLAEMDLHSGQLQQ